MSASLDIYIYGIIPCVYLSILTFCMEFDSLMPETLILKLVPCVCVRACVLVKVLFEV